MFEMSQYRIIDLSRELLPSEQKADGFHRHGSGTRPVELEEFYNALDGARMHFIHSQTHNGTHVEAAYKYSETGADIADTPLETYIGEAVACNFTHKAGQLITPDDFRETGVRGGEIVLVWGAPENRPHMDDTTIDWLIETRIKAIGMQNILSQPPGTPFRRDDPPRNPDARLLLGGVGLIDALVGLDQIVKQRVFFIALPIKMHRVTASWTRAIVLEER